MSGGPTLASESWTASDFVLGAKDLSFTTPCFPALSCLGGALIGIASGGYMLLSQRIAGNSGAFNALVRTVTFRQLHETPKLLFLLGLVTGGAVSGVVLPEVFEPAPPAGLALLVSSFAMGAGTKLGNGCTSGHGLCGLSRLSPRSLVAVPTFMAVAFGAATLRWGGLTHKPSIAPFETSDGGTLATTAYFAAALLALGAPLPLVSSAELRERLASAWSGALFAVGLASGGMCRPSAVAGALSPRRWDLTLWMLFTSALVTTFIFYRLAESRGNRMARWRPQAGASLFSEIDAKLIAGAGLFGLGWGLTGYCPGPLVTSLGAHPGAPGPLCVALGAGLGMATADPAWARLRGHSEEPTACKAGSNVSADKKAAGASPEDEAVAKGVVEAWAGEEGADEPPPPRESV